MSEDVVTATRSPDGSRPPSEPERDRLWSGVDALWVFVLTTVSGVARAVGLSDPDELIFDETYYAKDACAYVKAGSEICDNVGRSEVHPPLGKWLIAMGIEAFGYNSFGWRIAAVVAGTFTVVLLYVLARRLLRSTAAAVVASGLLAFDPLHFVQSRVAMLDVFATLFVVAALLAAVLDRDQTGDDERSRPWRYVAGAAIGAASASKWSAITFVPALMLLHVAWGTSRHEGPRPRAWARAVVRDGPSIFVAFVVVPLVVYVTSYVGRVDGAWVAAPWSETSWARFWWEEQFRMLDFHMDLEATHSYQSPAWSWLLLKRPVAYFFEKTPAGDYREIMALGNPFVWWSSVIALVYVTYRWLRGRARRGAAGVIVGAFAFGYLPWLAMDVASPRSATFLFYLLPVVPAMCLALGYVVTRIGSSWEARAAVAVFAAIALGLFVYYHPLLTGRPLSYEGWRDRVCFVRTGQGTEDQRCLFASEQQCEKPKQEDAADRPGQTDGEGAEATVPPKGWCWI